MSDTIFAPATVPGKSAVAMVRISGPMAFEVAERLTGAIVAPRRASLRWLRDPQSGDRLDQAIVLGFPGPGSFTGEDCVELQTHGSGAVIRALLATLAGFEGLRLAAPGEFSRRALMNNRLDLAQVEGLGDLLAAETSAQRRQAVGLLDGGLSALVGEWRGAVLRTLALVEATIDFSDEELPDDLVEVAMRDLVGPLDEMRRELDGAVASERLREGFDVALVGLPNAGKSTLLNRLARRDVALVSDQAGTTRDILEVRLDLRGLPVTVLDMAGLRDAEGIEAAGVERARLRARAADLRVFLVEDDSDLAVLGVACEADDIVVRGKADLHDEPGVSGATGKGVDDLLGRISDVLSLRVTGGGAISHARQRQATERALAALERGRGCLRLGDVELAAEELRLALASLDFLVGRVDVEAVLDVIFSSFCLGK
ncbi:tRNA uridine-5-carboxymethylaminomethyl(34) synthesis GTPase MnmE [Amaricoccus macauensis]|uniref:tRNA uridine-5-carboxymethylaminomethyl(34) synthesis GTPase MnmE n=1 Tax=Amaricoccus macauensis TaxID=57001 RepID=UPI001614BAE6|nr:tRNA uridine-5-carboxymethylaminomethyl(34) synthesis GTPase MnmE [Amaricoccus macauensis]